MNPILKYILKNPAVRNMAPVKLRKQIKKWFNLSEYSQAVFRGFNPYANTPFEWEYKGNYGFQIGIIYDTAHYHRYYMSACIDLGIGYKVIDIRKDKWFEEIKTLDTRVLMTWPSLTTAVLKEMIDERSKLIKDYMNITIYPNPEEIFILDNKRRVRDWLIVNELDPPATWCFYIKEEAEKFVDNCQIPIVFKSIKEGVSRGVVICRSRDKAREMVKKCFGKGYTPRNTDIRNRQWDFIMFQEYLPEVEERRMIRIGNNYLAIDKVRVGDFHSGSGQMKWANPERYFLDHTRLTTEKGGFRSMNVDFFLAQDGRTFINELHTMFHGPKITDDTYKGRYLYDAQKDEWVFQEGSYYRNYCCNLRIMDALQMAGIKLDLNMDWIKKPAYDYAEIPAK